ncbi:MAG: hypothetical protein AAGA30_03075, partial [Planctomycetota bacterium]
MAKVFEIPRLEFRQSVSPDWIEQSVDQIGQDIDTIPKLEVDMSECRYIQVTGLLGIVSFFAKRRSLGLNTTLRLPRLKKVRDFFRAWAFPAAIRHATGRSFFSTVATEDHKFFGENSSIEEMDYSGRVLEVGVGRNRRIERVLSEKFFEIKSFLSSDFDEGSRLAERESQRWKQEHVVSVLNRHLNGSGTSVSSHIVHEAMMNSIRHPNASLVQTASQIQNEKYLTICFWDNGESLVDTLVSAINAGKKIQASSVERLFEDYDLVIDEQDGKRTERTVRSDFVPSKHSSEEEVLIAATFP